jgi:hypothetical protein
MVLTITILAAIIAVQYLKISDLRAELNSRPPKPEPFPIEGFRFGVPEGTENQVHRKTEFPKIP